MAVVVISVNPGGTAELDEAIQQELNIAGSPDVGSMARLAGPVEGGWRIISVWESHEAFETFRRDRLEPALQRAGRPMPQFQISPLHSVRIAPQHG